MSREVCGVCWCPYDEDTGECACAPEPTPQRKGEHMTTLREAAQQALEACEQRLPLKGQAAIIDELNNLRAALAEPVQEPVGEVVAYIHRQGNHFEVSERHLDEDEKDRGWTEEPLYTAPPQRKPLPASEIVTMYDESPRGDSDMIDFARAIERAHGIGEQQCLRKR